MREAMTRGPRSSQVVSVAVMGMFVFGWLIVTTPVARAETWTESSEADFLGGTLTNVTVTPGGDVTLQAPATPSYAKQGMILGLGTPGAPDSLHATGPSVLRESDGTYKMWYTGYGGNRMRMMWADSPDGVAWTKRGIAIDILTAPHNWDSVGGMHVIKQGPTYHMWFAAGYWSGGPGPGGFWQQIYYATSTTGTAWTVQSVALGLGPLGSWDDSMVTTPFVLTDPGGTSHLYYAGWDGGPGYRIGHATSPTYSGFTRVGSGLLLDLGAPGSWEDASLGNTFVTAGPRWSMYYTASDGATGRVGIAFSDDAGYSWTRWIGNPWLVPGSPSAWDDGGVCCADEVWTPGGVRLYYAGSDGANTRIGYALLTRGYSPLGTYVSGVFDAGSGGTRWQTVAWNASTPASTNVALSVREGDTATPDGSWSAWAPVTGPPSGTTLSLSRTRYLQYIVTLTTGDTSVTPSVHDVTFTYERNGAPAAIALSPSGGEWLATTPLLAWDVADPEGDPQASFEVQLSSDDTFSDLLSSGVRDSSVKGWQPPPIGDGLWYWRVRVRDLYGLWGSWSTESFGVDGSSPVTSASLAGTLGSGGWYTGAVTVSLIATDATSGVALTSYRVDGGLWSAYVGPVSVTTDGVHEVDFFSTDVARNTERVSLAMFGIDSSPPTTTAALIGTVGSSGWYTSPVTVALDRTDGVSGVVETSVRLDGGPWQTYASPVLVSADGAHALEFRSTDRAGLIEPTRSTSFRIDSTAPEAVASLAGPVGTNGWLVGPVTVALSGTDSTSGVSSLRFRVDGGLWQSYASPFAVSADGPHVVEFFAIDAAGVEGTPSFVTFRIDAMAPATNSLLFGDIGSGGFYTMAVTVSLTATDAASGVYDTRYRVDSGSWEAYAGPFEVAGDGAHAIEFLSTDFAGLTEAMRSTAFSIDTVLPVTDAVSDGPIGDSGWFRGVVTVTLSAEDATSGVAMTRYRVDAGTWQTYTAAFPVSGDGIHPVEFYSVDVAGSIEISKSTSVSIDGTAPLSTATVSGSSGTGGFHTTPVAVTLGATDSMSGVAAMKFRVDDGSWQSYETTTLVSEDGEHLVEFYAVDRAGVAEAVRSTAFKIDTTPPATTVSLSGPRGVAGFFTGPVVASLASTDATSGISATEYRLDGRAWVRYVAPFRIAQEGFHVIEFRSTDNAGLVESVKVVSFSIDKAPLSVTGPYGPSLLVTLIAVMAAFLALLLGIALGRRRQRKESEPVPPETPEQ